MWQSVNDRHSQDNPCLNGIIVQLAVSCCVVLCALMNELYTTQDEEDKSGSQPLHDSSMRLY